MLTSCQVFLVAVVAVIRVAETQEYAMEVVEVAETPVEVEEEAVETPVEEMVGEVEEDHPVEEMAEA